MAEDNNSPANAEGGGFTGGTASPGGQESMGGTLGTLNSSPAVENSGTSVSVMGAVSPLGGGLGNASASNLAFNPSAMGVQPGSFGLNTGAVNPSQFSLADPNKQQSTGLSPASIGATPTMGLLGNTPFSQQTGALHPGSVDSGMASNPGALNNGMAGLPGHIPGSTGIPDSTQFSPIAPSVPQPSQTNNLLSWSQEPASTKNTQAASYMPSGLGYASLSSPSAPSSPANPFQNTSPSPLNAGYSVLATPHERDMAIRTIAAEADPSTQGYAAVAAVIANRAALNGQPDPLTGMSYPGSVGGVISQPSQFSGYNDHNYRGIDPTSDRYQHIGSVFDNVLSGQLSDPTGGATYYYAPSGMPNGLAPSWAKNLPAGQTIGTQVFFGGTPSQPASQAASITPDQTGNRLSWSEVPSNAPSVQPMNSPPNPYGSLFRAPPAPLVSLNSMPAGLGYSAYTGTQTPGNAITIGPGGPQSTQPSLGTIASPWGTGTSDEAMNFAMARGPAGLAANMIMPSTANPATARADIPQGDYDSSALQYAPTRTAPSLVPLSSENGQRPNPALATYDNGMLFNPNYGENNSGVVGQWGVPGSAESQPSSVYSPESPLLNRPYVAAYSPGLLSALPSESTPQVAASATAAPTIPTGVVSPAPATIASPSERPPLTVNAPHSPDTKNAASGYDLHPVDYNPFPNSQPTKLQGSDFLNSPNGSFGRGFNYLAGHGGTYSSPGGGMGTPSPTTQQSPPAASTDTTAPAPPPFQSWYKDASGNWYFGQAPEGYISPFPFVTPSVPTIPEGFAGGGGVSFVNNDTMADPEQSAKDDAYVPDEPIPAPSYSLHPVEYDPFTTQQDSNVALNNAVAYSGSLRSQERRQQADAGWQDAYQTFAKPAVDFVTAPKRIMSGELTPSDPEFTDSAIQGAAMLTGRGLASPGEGYGIFGGTGSAAAPPFVNTAKMRLWAGADPAKVWKDTGWMKEVTGNKMMHEISDKNSAMKPISGDMIDKPLSVADIFHHPELEKHYPGILDTPAQVRSDLPSNVYGGFNPNDGSIVLNADRSPSDMRDTILHELNHAVQMKEGFSHGYNPDAPAVKQFVTEYNASNYPPISNYDVYHQMEGEDKSFATMNRKDMTDAERRSSPPWRSSNLPSGTPLYDANKMQRWYYGKEDTPTPVVPQLSAGPLHDEAVRDLSGKTAGGEDPTRGLANAKTSDAGPVEKNALRRTRNMIQDLGGNKPSPKISETGLDGLKKERSVIMSKLAHQPGANERSSLEGRLRVINEQLAARPGFAKGGAVKKRNKDEFDWNIPLSKQSEHIQNLIRARLET